VSEIVAVSEIDPVGEMLAVSEILAEQLTLGEIEILAVSEIDPVGEMLALAEIVALSDSLEVSETLGDIDRLGVMVTEAEFEIDSLTEAELLMLGVVELLELTEIPGVTLSVGVSEILVVVLTLVVSEIVPL